MKSMESMYMLIADVAHTHTHLGWGGVLRHNLGVSTEHASLLSLSQRRCQEPAVHQTFRVVVFLPSKEHR